MFTKFVLSVCVISTSAVIAQHFFTLVWKNQGKLKRLFFFYPAVELHGQGHTGGMDHWMFDVQQLSLSHYM